MIHWKKQLLEAELEADPIALAVSRWEKIAPGFSVAEEGKEKLRKLIRQFDICDLLTAMEDCKKYLKFDKDGDVTEDSWGKAFNKLGPILKANEIGKETPAMKEILYYRGILRNTVGGERVESDSVRIMHDAWKEGISLPDLREICEKVDSWRDFEMHITGALVDMDMRNEYE